MVKVIVWMVIIFLLTCTTPVFAVLYGDINFTFNTDPNWSGFWTVPSEGGISGIEFGAHFLMFFALTAFLKSAVNRVASAFWIACLYGILIEIVQPFFGRGTELIDVLANVAGIVTFIVLYKLEKAVKRVRLFERHNW